jgi:hypothetical protein
VSGNQGAAHFQLFTSDVRGLIKWRLLSGNNRELGRSVRGYLDAETGQLGVKEFVENIELLSASVRRRDDGRWGWALLREDEPWAVCGHPYDRQVRCDQALMIFTELAVEARPGSGVIVSAARRWSHPSQGRRPIALNSGVDNRPSSSRTLR